MTSTELQEQRDAPVATAVARPRVSMNVATTIAAQLLTWAMSFAVVLYLPAYLGPGGLGKLSLAGAFAAVLTALVPLGTSTVLVKEVSRRHDCALPLLAASLTARLPLSFLATAAAYGVARLMHLDHVSTVLVLVCSGGAAFALINDAVISTLQGLERLPRQNAVAVVEKLFWALLTIGAVAARHPLWQIAMVPWISSTVAVIGNLTALPRDRSWKLPTLGETISVASMGLPFLGWSLCVALYGQSDPMVIRAITGRDLDIGWYGVTTKLVGTTLFLPAALTTALLPRLSRLHIENKAEFERLARKALSMGMLLGVPIAIALGVMPGRVLHMLPYGAKFDAAIDVLRIGGPGLLLWYLGILLGGFVMARDGQNRMLRAAGAAAIVGIPLCALLSKMTFAAEGNAAVGAIAADCLCELFLVICYVRMLPRGIVDIRFAGFVARCAAASIPAIACLSIGMAHIGPWSIVPSAVVYVVCCLVLRCIEPEDLALLRSLASRRSNEGS